MLLEILVQIAYAADDAPGFTMTDIWHHAGPIAKGVIAILAFLMAAAAFVSVERLIAFRSARNQSIAVAGAVGGPLSKGDVAGALKVVKDEAYQSSYLAAILGAGLAEMALRADGIGVKNAERAVEKAIGEEAGKLQRGMTWLATVGSTAPFVGLFGTTFGVINAFQGMASAGSGLAAISAGISEALITTGVGIGVAVIGVWAFNYFNSRIAKVNEEMVSSEAEFMDWAHKLAQSNAEATPLAGK